MTTASIHLLVCSAAVAWAYKVHQGEHHFEKLPSVDDWGGESSEVVPEPDTVGMEMELDDIGLGGDEEVGSGSGESDGDTPGGHL